MVPPAFMKNEQARISSEASLQIWTAYRVGCQMMRAMLLRSQKKPLQASEVAVPQPGPGQVLVEVCACGVCRTDLHVVDGELTDPRLPLIPGHEIVGRVVAGGAGVERF